MCERGNGRVCVGVGVILGERERGGEKIEWVEAKTWWTKKPTKK